MSVWLILTGGCVAPRATLLQPDCRRIVRDSRLEALAFRATVETRGLAGEQLIYEVSLRNAAGKPIRSADGHYQNMAGAVSASKTLMVFESPATFEDVALSIPAGELHIGEGDWPVSARFRLYNVAGDSLAQVACAVPPAPAIHVATARPAKTAPPRTMTTKSPGTTVPRKDQRTTPPPATQPATRAPGPERLTTTRPTTRPRVPAPGGRPATTAPAATQPTAQPTKPRPIPPAQKSPPRGRPETRPAGRRHATTSDLDVSAPLDTLVNPPGDLAKDLRGPVDVAGQGAATRPATPRIATTRPAITSRPLPPTSVETRPGGKSAPRPGTRPASTAPAETKQVSGRTRYVVQKGDRLTRIAQRVLGDAARWEEIYALNRDQLASPDHLREGMVLWVPEAEPPEERK
jgi:nucleoid-associated protein YgaU